MYCASGISTLVATSLLRPHHSATISFLGLRYASRLITDDVSTGVHSSVKILQASIGSIHFDLF